MSYDDVTTPMPSALDHPTWPVMGPTRASRRARPAPRAGCGLWLGVVGAFVAGMIVSAALFGAFFAPQALSSTPGAQTDGALKVTITDSFLRKALAASDNRSLTNIQAHIQTDGRLTISGVLQGTVFGAGHTAVVVLAPAVSQGALTVTAISGSIGGFALPAIALTPIASAVNKQLAQGSRVSLGGGASLTARGIAFADGQMTISYG